MPAAEVTWQVQSTRRGDIFGQSCSRPWEEVGAVVKVVRAGRAGGVGCGQERWAMHFILSVHPPFVRDLSSCGGNPLATLKRLAGLGADGAHVPSYAHRLALPSLIIEV